MVPRVETAAKDAALKSVQESLPDVERQTREVPDAKRALWHYL
jgi:hypothetical protein